MPMPPFTAFVRPGEPFVDIPANPPSALVLRNDLNRAHPAPV